jgi:hypothetical protein
MWLVKCLQPHIEEHLGNLQTIGNVEFAKPTLFPNPFSASLCNFLEDIEPASLLAGLMYPL